MDLDTLTVTERKHIEHPNRRKVLSNKHSRRFNNNDEENVFSLQDVHPNERQCVPIESGYCSNLPYNITTYPNMLGHQNIQQVDMVIDMIKEIVDSNCHPLAYE